jgi:uncharacterized protein
VFYDRVFMNDTTDSNSNAWWRFPMVWMVIAGPVVVVLASFVTFYLAASGKDPLVDEDYYRNGLAAQQATGEKASSLAPAVQARNHAATGVPAPKQLVPAAP